VPADPDARLGEIRRGQQGDIRDQRAQQPLAIPRRSGRCVPQGSDVGGEGFELGARRQNGSCSLHLRECLLGFSQDDQPRFPAGFEVACHEPVLRLAAMECPLGPLGLVACALHGELGGPGAATPPLSNLVGSGKRQGHLFWVEGGQEPFCHGIVDGDGTDRAAGRRAHLVGLGGGALIGGVPVGVVAGRHRAPTGPAGDDALAQGLSLPWREGRRDRALLLAAVQTGLRISELTGLNCCDVTFGDGASVRCEGKGRKQRAVPLSRPCEAILKVWMNERAGRRDEPLFPTRTGRRLSADAVQRIVRKHAQVAASRCPSLRAEKLHPHTLRHSCAMALLHERVDTAVIALWLGHAGRRSTDAYVHADMTIKQRALELTSPASTPPGCYRPPDRLLAFLESL
jgi:hypothetical protein